MAIGLTRRQAETLKFIGAYWAANGISPVYTEVLAHLGLSQNSKGCVNRLVVALVERGYVERIPSCRRSVCLTAGGEAYVARFGGAA